MIANGFTATVTRRTSTGVDGRGNTIYTTATHTIARCGYAPATGQELFEAGRDGVVVVGALMCDDVTADLQTDDEVTFDGQTFAIEGEPNRWNNPHSGKGRGLEAALRRVEG